MDKTLFVIKNRRQFRAILALLEKESILVADLGKEIGALNPRQIVMELRRQGFFDAIKTRRLVAIDRDGNPCQPGEYFIAKKQKEKIWKFLELTQASNTWANKDTKLNSDDKEGL